MNATVTFMPEKNAIIAKTHKNFLIAEDAEALQAELLRMVETASEPVTVIFDSSGHEASLNDLMLGAKQGMTKNNPANHPNTKKVIIVSTSSLVIKAADGFRKLGVLKGLEVVGSLDEALARA